MRNRQAKFNLAGPEASQPLLEALLAIHREGAEVLCHVEQATIGPQLTWNSDFGRILGFEPGECKPTVESFPSLVPEKWKRQVTTDLDDVLASRRQDAVFPIFDAFGKPVWMSIRSGMLDDGRLVLAFRKVDESQEIIARAAEKRRTETVSTMAAGIAHEFNNQLTPIRGFIEMAADQLGHKHPASDDLQIALRQVDDCSDLIEHIQTYGGKLVLAPRATDLGTLTCSQVRNVLTISGAKHISICEQIEDDLPLVDLDHNTYRKAIAHLVENSLAACGKKGAVTIDIRHVEADTVPAPRDESGNGSYIQVCLSDTGSGMERDVLQRVMDPFFTTKGRAQARGLGLSMVQGMVRQHGGFMNIHSVPGKGTWVRLWFPCASREETTKEGDTVHVLPAAPVGRVLVADDEPVIRQLISKVFQGEGWVVEEADNYREVLIKLERNANVFDLLILDVTMPGPDPEEAIRLIKQSDSQAKIMFVTGMVPDAKLMRLVESADGGYMQKPFSPMALLSRVDDFLVKG